MMTVGPKVNEQVADLGISNTRAGRSRSPSSSRNGILQGDSGRGHRVCPGTKSAWVKLPPIVVNLNSITIVSSILATSRSPSSPDVCQILGINVKVKPTSWGCCLLWPAEGIRQAARKTCAHNPRTNAHASVRSPQGDTHLERT